MRILKIISITLLLLIVISLMFLKLVLPGLLKSRLVATLEQMTGRSASVEQVTVRPFSMTVGARHLAIRGGPGTEPFLSISSARVTLSPRSITKGALIVSDVDIISPSVFAVRTAPNTFSFSDIIEHYRKRPESRGGGIDYLINNLTISRGSVTLKDQAQPRTPVHTVTELEVTVPSIGTLPSVMKDPIKPSFSAVVNGSPLRVEGTVRTKGEGAFASAEVRLKNVDLADYQGYLPEKQPLRISSGKAFLDAAIKYRAQPDKRPDLIISGTVRVRDLLVRDQGGDRLFALEKGNLELAEGRLFAQEFHVAKLLLEGFNAHIKRAANEGARKSGSSDKSSTQSLRGRIKLRIDKATARDGAIKFTDRKVPEGFSAEMRDLKLEVEGFSTAGGRARYSMSSSLRHAGRNAGHVAVKGTGSVAPLAADATANLERVTLQPLNPYLAKFIDASVAGTLSAGITADVRRTDGKVSGKYGGSAEINAFRLRGTSNGRELLAWRRLILNEVSGRLTPFSFVAGSLRMDDYVVRPVIHEDGSLNFTRLLKQRKQPDEAQKKKGLRLPSMTVRRIELKQGEIIFEDRHLKNRYNGLLLLRQWTMKGLSTETGETAEVNLEGSLGHHAPLRVNGKIRPFPEYAADLKASLDNVALPPLSPYAAAYAGRRIVRGKLFLDLQYDVHEKKLQGKNEIRIDRLSLGQEVDSKKAADIPLGLAVSLLKNDRGVIKLTLPVGGRIDNPQFNIWRLLWRTADDLLTGLASAPFEYLASLFQQERDEDFRTIYFSAGSAELSEKQQRKLQDLARGLKERTELRLTVAGFVDEESDGRAYSGNLRDLALERVRSVRYFLEKQGRVDPKRLFTRVGDIDRPPRHPVKTKARVEFDLPGQ